MSQDDLSVFPLRVTRVGVGGKRSFDRDDKRRLIEACLRPGASLSGLALKAGVNANQLRKWVRQYGQEEEAAVCDGVAGPSAFVPVVAIDDAAPTLIPVPAAPCAPELARRREPSRAPSRSAPPAHLSATLPNGVVVELACSEGDASLVTAMIAALVGTR